MRAIILAAGVGRRLSSSHSGAKCLLEFGGHSLLARHYLALKAGGIHEVTLCVGHLSDSVITAVAALDVQQGMSTTVFHNPLYTLGSVVSLWCARAGLLAGDSVILMDADVLYDPAIIDRLVNADAADCMLLDRDFMPGDEPVKICQAKGKVVEFRKQLAPDLQYDVIGESVGFFKLSPDSALDISMRTGAYSADERREKPHEEVIRDFILSRGGAMAVEDITGLPWIEIDFPDDLTRAARDILPRIH